MFSMNVNINITVKPDGKSSIEMDKEDGHGILKLKKKTKHGIENIVRLPPMVEDNYQRSGILQNLGL